MYLMVEINYATEGIVDASVAEKLIRLCGAIPGLPRVAGGKTKLDPNIPRYAQSANWLPWLILRDLDNDAPCGAELRRALLDGDVPLLCLRIAVRQIEAWLMLDREAIASFLKVPLEKVPANPEELPHAKRAMIDLARHSSSRSIRQALVPREGVGASEGPEFAAQMLQFARDHWRPDVAAAAQPMSSLARAIECLRSLAARAEPN
jgi:hypothetical protein